MVLYSGDDPREIGAYPIGLASKYLKIPRSTLRHWVDPDTGVLRLPAVGMLSFTNLVEAHVLATLTRDPSQRLSLQKIRRAIRYIEDQWGEAHPLARERLFLEGGRLLVERYGALVPLDGSGQLAMRELLMAGLRRVDYEKELAARLFPLVRPYELDQPKLIVIDPQRGFGRAIVASAGVRVDALFDRFQGGDTIATLSLDYQLAPEVVEEALRVAA